MSGGGGEEGEFGLQIAPLLDVLFVLLLFFMVTAGSKEREAELGIRLPSRGSMGETPQTPINIRILPGGEILYNDARLKVKEGRDLPELVGRLKSIIAKFDDQPVIILPSAQAQHQRIVDVLNACNAADVKNLAFGTPPA